MKDPSSVSRACRSRREILRFAQDDGRIAASSH
jgi:hypothetical protein